MNLPPPSPQPKPQPQEERWRPTKKEIIAGIIVVIAAVFIIQNNEKAEFHFLLFKFEAQEWIWLLAIFAAGVGTGLLIASRRAKKKAAATRSESPE
jgi:lipopolysaccharide assembly protein A